MLPKRKTLKIMPNMPNFSVTLPTHSLTYSPAHFQLAGRPVPNFEF